MNNLSEIDTNTIEGRMLIAALSMLSCGMEYSSLHPDAILAKVYDRQALIYEHSHQIQRENYKEQSFQEQVTTVINKKSMENLSNTPDFLLARYLCNCLNAYTEVVCARDKWFNVDMWANKSEIGLKD